MSNPLVELGKLGQSVWYDQMERALISEGTLQKMIERDDLRGLTSNPTIFEKAIGGSDDYDEQIRELATGGKTRDEIYEAIVVEDIRRAADVFRPVYDRTKGDDGYCSLEVSPLLAHDTAGTVSEAKRLWAALERPNVMIKIPATPEGIPAIEQTIASGINVNVTLIFSQDVYRQVMDAYIKGLEHRVAEGQPINSIASVASFFVSRIDTKAEKEIDARIKGGDESLRTLLGTIAISNAKVAYQMFLAVFGSERFGKLQHHGARRQRPLWASTGTKNPNYSDVLYIEQLVAAETVNTIPPATYEAFRDHGKVAPTIGRDVEAARNNLDALEKAGISLEAITKQLTAEGVKSFADSFHSLMATIEARRDIVLRASKGRETAALGKYMAAVDEALTKIEQEKIVSRIWKREPEVWKSDEAHRKIIANALGWLTVAEEVRRNVDELRAFAEQVRGDFDAVVVLGMGGSSLCSEVTRTAFGRKSGYPELLVLDSTVPSAIRALERKLNLERTLFIVASKSGSTTEPRVFHKYFYDRVRQLRGEKAGENFIAVTDPSTQLEREAKDDRFRKIFLNPADIGGRYSALSYFGMVPAAIAGYDVAGLLDRAIHAMHVCSPLLPPFQNRGALLGAILGALASNGRDKLTIVASPPFEKLGLWIEQLVAESTGKEGKGILPIALEPLGAPADYGEDRLFVWVRSKDGDDRSIRARLRELESAGHPVVEHVLEDAIDLGDEFFIWEFATAVAGSLLSINPFDQPNVQESKDNTKSLLDEYASNRAFRADDPLLSEGEIKVFPSKKSREIPNGSKSLVSALAALLGSARKGDYVALTEYVEETPETDDLLGKIRSDIMKGLRVATTSGYGPRFLHSTGQLHKGGGDNGIFIQITSDDAEDLSIEGEGFTFGVLKEAQSRGDFASLDSRERRALRVHLGRDVNKGLKQLHSAVQEAMATAGVGG